MMKVCSTQFSLLHCVVFDKADTNEQTAVKIKLLIFFFRKTSYRLKSFHFFYNWQKFVRYKSLENTEMSEIFMPLDRNETAFPN